jgi:uncharacterized SAM-binding protein YcdF (DUF218 family)
MNKNFRKKRWRKKERLKFKVQKFVILLIISGLMISISIIPFRLAIALYQVPKPQAIFVLGGNFNRIIYAAKLAQKHPDLNIWVSDYPYTSEIYKRLFQKAGIAPERIHYDFCATDTVTNFTCTVNKFVEKDLKHLYLVTSDYHMARAQAIATLVFGSRGIAITPVTVRSNGDPPESKLRIVRDFIRSAIWMATGRTGAGFNPRLKQKLS